MRKTKQNNQRKKSVRKTVTKTKPNWRKAVGSAASIAADFLLPGSGPLVGGIGKLLGFGAYTRQGAETWLASNVPAMHATLDRGVRITHHEYLGEMLSSTAFALITYPVNPGMARTFPWLSSLAAAFQKWEDHGIVFYFKSTSATALNSVNTALGSVMGAVTYNPYQIPPADKVTMLGLSGVQTGKPAEDNLFPVECKMSQSLFGTKLIRNCAVADDLAKYDAGNFHLATVGSQAIATVGELHIVYDITLKEPKLAPFGYCSNYSFTGWNINKPFDVATKSLKYDNIGILFEDIDAFNVDVILPASIASVGATYTFRFEWYGDMLVGAGITPDVHLTNLTYQNYFSGATQHTRIFGNYPDCDRTGLEFCVAVTDPRIESRIRLEGGITNVPANTTIYVTVEEVHGA